MKLPNQYPTPRSMRQLDAIAYLGRKVHDDAVAAGRLKVACAPSRKMVFYRTADVLQIDQEISEGNYPGKGGGDE